MKSSLRVRSCATATARAVMQLFGLSGSRSASRNASASASAPASAPAPAPASASATATASFADGRLVLPARDGSVKVSIPESEIVCVARGPDGVYRVARLTEHSGGSESIAGAPPTPRYAFTAVRLEDRDVQSLPPDFVAKHVLTAAPAVLPSASPSSSLHIVVSTGSGLGQAEPVYDGVLGPLLRDVFGLEAVQTDTPPGDKQYALLVTESKDSIKTFARTLPAAATVVLLSGDGGVVDMLNGVDASGVDANGVDTDSSRRPTIALLPLGTGNALFHSLHKPAYEAAAAATTNLPPPSPLVHGLRTLFHGTPAPLPSFEATFAPGSHTVGDEGDGDGDGDNNTEVLRLHGAIVASYGFHAQLVWESDTPAYRKHGDARFGIVAGELIKESHAYATDVGVRTADAAGAASKRNIGHAFNYVLATLVSELQQGFTISPASRPLDGQLRLVHFGAVGGSRTMELMMLAYRQGEHVREGDVGYEAVDEVEIGIREEDARWRKACIDGTIVEIPQGGWMRVRKAGKPVLNIITSLAGGGV